MSGPALRVIQPGLHTTVQDLGRIGSQHLGIPVSGALDPVALRVANIVAGNPQPTAGLEIAVTGPVLEVVADSMRIAVAGEGAHLIIEAADGSPPRRVPALQSAYLRRGDRLRVVAATESAVAYLAIEGGLAIASFLGSLSTYTRGGFGGLDGRALKAGDDLPLLAPAAESRPEMHLTDVDLAPPATIRVVLGPQDDHFSPTTIDAFLGGAYTVSRDADRMGLRLEGPLLDHVKGYNIVSDGIAPGSIQVPGSRQPIVLLADRQTTGGYPKIATIVSADLAATGRLIPGATVRFVAVSLAEAYAARRAIEATMAALAGRLSAVRPDGPDPDRLYDSNLISGVIDARAPASASIAHEA
jgi:biotin-dependent carboxylase-like uncharacterized protein